MKILCVCAQGLNRSRWVAEYLAERGFDTRYGGVEENAENPVNPADFLWADVVLIARDRHQGILHRRFGAQKKEIVLGVSDSRSLVPKEYADLRQLPGDVFHKTWTYPRLKAVVDRLLVDGDLS